MPTVPSSQGPSVSPSARPSLRTSPEVFGGGAAAAPIDTRAIADAAYRIGQDERNKANQIAVLDAGSRLTALETALLHDPGHGALNTRGKQAFDVHDRVTAQWGTHVGEIESTLSNDDQRLAFRRMVDARAASLDEQLQRHVAGERRTYDNQATEAYLQTEAAAGLSSYADEARVQASIENRAAALAGYGERNGVAPERIAQQSAAMRSQTRAAVVERFLATGDDLTAKAYYDAHKDDILGADAVQLDKSLEEGSARGESQKQADAILTKATTLTDAVRAAREIKDPRVRDLTESRVRQDFTERQQAARAQGEADFQNATNIVGQTKTVTRVPPKLWSTFTVAERESLTRYAEHLQEGRKPETDWSTYYSLRTLATTEGTRARFLSRNLMVDRPLLADAQFKELVDLQGSMRAGDGKAESKLDSFRTKDDIVTSTLRAIGLGVSDKTKDRQRDASVIDVIRRSVDYQVEQAQERTGKPVARADVQKIVDEIVTQHVVSTPGRLFGRNDSEKRLYELAPNDSLVLSIKDVPRGDRTALEQQLRAQRLPVTDAAIVDAYRRYLSSLVRRGPR